MLQRFSYRGEVSKPLSSLMRIHSNLFGLHGSLPMRLLFYNMDITWCTDIPKDVLKPVTIGCSFNLRRDYTYGDGEIVFGHICSVIEYTIRTRLSGGVPSYTTQFEIDSRGRVSPEFLIFMKRFQ